MAAVVGHNQMGAVADFQPLAGVDSVAFESVKLVEQSLRVDNDSLADHGNFARPQDSRRDQLQNEFLAVRNNGMAGVGAALVACDNVKMF